MFYLYKGRKQLGFADQIAFLDPPEDSVRLQKANDKARRRSNFETHVRLYAPLRRWYVMLENLSLGRIVLNAHQVKDWTPTHLRTDRYNLQLFDALIDAADRPVG